MNETSAPQHIRDFVQGMVEVGVQLSTMLEHMYHFQATNADANGTPPPEVLRDLVAKTLQSRFRASRRDIQRSTHLLRLSSRTIADELVLVDPDTLHDWDDDELEVVPEDGEFDPRLN